VHCRDHVEVTVAVAFTRFFLKIGNLFLGDLRDESAANHWVGWVAMLG
jgi:hypothetical protein